MKTLEAANIQLEILDFEECFLIGIAIKKGVLTWLEKFQLKSIREKRLNIYKTTYLK